MERTNQLVLTFLLNAGWQLAVIATVTSLCAWLLRKTSARYQHRLWVIAIMLSLGFPALSASRLFSADFFTRQERQQTTTFAESSLLDTTTPVTAPVKETSSFFRVNRNIATGLVALYFLFLCFGILKLLKAWLRTKAISRSAYRIEFPDSVEAVIGRCREAVGVKKVRILCSNDVTVPMTVGSLNPMVIVPEQLLREADADVLTSAIGHELVHVLRRDYFLNLIYELIYLPLLFHPAAALVRRRIRQTRELRCDELVTERLMKAEVYARSLVRLAGSAVALGRSTTTLSVGVADADILEERVMTMLRRPKISIRRKNLLLITVALGFSVPCIAAAPYSLPVSIATPGAARAPRPEATEVIQTQEVQEKEGKQGSESSARRRAALEARRRREERDIETLRQRLERAEQAQRPDEQETLKRELRAKEEAMEKLERELKGRIYTFSNELSEQERREREQLEREKKAKRQAELAKKATVTMQQAIQIAMSQQTGTVLECRLVGERDDVFYHTQILSGDEPETTITHLLISALDGRVVKIEREKR